MTAVLAGHRPRTGVVEPRALHWARLAAAWLLRRCFRLQVHGLEHVPRTGAVLVAGNHSSFLDGPLVFIVLPRPSAFLVKQEMYVGPLRWFLPAVRQIPVRRGHPDRAALARALRVLQDGGALGMYPEGTRGDGLVEHVQHGIGYLVVKSGAPVVPVVCLGTRDALPRGQLRPRFGARIDVVFGAPFRVQVDGDPSARRTFAAAAEQVGAHLREHLQAAGEQVGHPVPGLRRSA